MYCRFCGKEIEDNSSFCSYCGKDQNNMLSEIDSSLSRAFFSAEEKKIEPKHNAGKEVFCFILICIGTGISLMFSNSQNAIVCVCICMVGFLMISLAFKHTNSMHNVRMSFFSGLLHINSGLYQLFVNFFVLRKVYIEAGMAEYLMPVYLLKGMLLVFGVILILLSIRKRKRIVQSIPIEKSYYMAWVGGIMSISICRLLFVTGGSAILGFVTHLIGLFLLLIALISAKTNSTRIICIIMGLFETLVAFVIIGWVDMYMFYVYIPLFMYGLALIIIPVITITVKSSKK